MFGTVVTGLSDGVTYHVQSFNSLNMVMTERNGRWICLIGRVPTERLMELALRLLARRRRVRLVCLWVLLTEGSGLWLA